MEFRPFPSILPIQGNVISQRCVYWPSSEQIEEEYKMMLLAEQKP